MFYVFIALIFYTLGIILTAVATRHTDTNLVAAIANSMASIIPIIIVIPILNKQTLINGKYGIIMAVLSGICIAIFSITYNKSLSLNKVAIVNPVIFGGMIFLTAILSYILFKEKISFFQGIGLTLMGIGLLCIIYAKLSGK